MGTERGGALPTRPPEVAFPSQGDRARKGHLCNPTEFPLTRSQVQVLESKREAFVETLTIGRLAERGGVNLETIRYYERQGIMPPPARKSSGHRAYSPDAIRRLRFIKRSQELGFSLAEIKELLALRLDPTQLCTEVIDQIDAKIREVDQKITHLKAIRRVLVRMRGSCDGACEVSECPILESLGKEVS